MENISIMLRLVISTTLFCISLETGLTGDDNAVPPQKEQSASPADDSETSIGAGRTTSTARQEDSEKLSAEAALPRPVLQVINGSGQPIEVYWLKSDNERIPNGKVAPGISGKDYWDARARGMGGSTRDPFCSCAEENLLGYPGDPYAAECILIHELAHNIHLRGMVNVDPTFDQRLKATYVAAMAAGLWKGKYASVNHHEYFAEGVQSWFDNNRENDHDHNHVNTREELLDYDPRLAALCREVFGDTELRYTKPATRLTGHLQGYDPAKAPRFEWPQRLNEAKVQIRRAAQQRDQSKSQP
jgi:hypothetical protein